MQSVLVINEISLLVRMGCLEDERQHPQLVKVRVKLTFPPFSNQAAPPHFEPAGIATDELTDTLCYDVITGQLKKVSLQKEFKLVEHLGGEFFKVLRESIDKKIKIAIELTKVKPPVNEITGGVTFIYGDAE